MTVQTNASREKKVSKKTHGVPPKSQELELHQNCSGKQNSQLKSQYAAEPNHLISCTIIPCAKLPLEAGKLFTKTTTTLFGQ